MAHAHLRGVQSTCVTLYKEHIIIRAIVGNKRTQHYTERSSYNLALLVFASSGNLICSVFFVGDIRNMLHVPLLAFPLI